MIVLELNLYVDALLFTYSTPLSKFKLQTWSGCFLTPFSSIILKFSLLFQKTSICQYQKYPREPGKDAENNLPKTRLLHFILFNFLISFLLSEHLCLQDT